MCEVFAKCAVPILLCGGNDCERYPVQEVINEYENLISTVRAECGPDTSIRLCKVPPRGSDSRISYAIDQLNAFIEGRACENDSVFAVNVCPKSQGLFVKDRIHFNNKGKHSVANNLARYIVNFPWQQESVLST